MKEEYFKISLNARNNCSFQSDSLQIRNTNSLRCQVYSEKTRIWWFFCFVLFFPFWVCISIPTWDFKRLRYTRNGARGCVMPPRHLMSFFFFSIQLRSGPLLYQCLHATRPAITHSLLTTFLPTASSQFGIF